jgi:DNA-binding transcriptional LysR family regulator
LRARIVLLEIADVRVQGTSLHHRQDRSNIPTELLRSLVVIDDVGSFTKAAAVLRLTQPAISGQIRRLEKLVAAKLFVKSGGGLQLTEEGRIVTGYARRIVALHDQLLALGGADPKAKELRIGLPRGIDQEMVVALIKGVSDGPERAAVHIRCARSDELVRGLATDHLDLAFIAHAPTPPPVIVREWSERLNWVRSPQFLLPSNAPVPLVSWPHGLSDRVALEAFQNAGTKYAIAFVGQDRSVCRAAVQAGVGVMVATERSVRLSKLHAAREFYLPSLPDIRVGIYARKGLDLLQVGPITRIMETILKPESTLEG